MLCGAARLEQKCTGGAPRPVVRTCDARSAMLHGVVGGRMGGGARGAGR